MKAILTKTQVVNTAKYLYDISKFIAVGGIVTPLLNEEQPRRTVYYILLSAMVLYILAVILDGVADHMGEHQ